MLLLLAACHGPPASDADIHPAPADTGSGYCGDGWSWYPDEDGDGYGNWRGPAFVRYCHSDTPPEGYVPVPDCWETGLGEGYDSCWEAGHDCDDDDAAIHPYAEEVWYDGVDTDCDGESDADADRDGHDAGAAGGDDCDDADGAVNPDAPERCDGDDDDCDGAVDGPPCGVTGGRADAAQVIASGVDELWGWDLANLGDVDGDGTDDLLVTSSLGADFVLADVRDAVSVGGDAIATVPWAAGARLYAGAAGDLDGDSLGDLWLVDHDARAAAFVPGPLAGALTLEMAAWTQDVFTTFARADVTGDGHPDVIADGCIAVAPLARGERVADRCVAEVAAGARGAGDLDGDGLEDLVRVDTYDTARVYVFHAPFDGVVDGADADGTFAWEPDTEAGDVSAPLGDVDGDGLADLALGNWRWADPADLRHAPGSAYVVLGPAAGVDTLADAWAKLRGEETGEGFAWTLHGPGDLDGDARGDLVIGGWDEEIADAAGWGWGAVWVLHGIAPGTWVAGTLGTKWRGGPELGYASFSDGLGSGDFDGDGARELVFGLDGGYDAGSDALWIVTP